MTRAWWVARAPERDELGQGQPGRLVHDEPARLELDTQPVTQAPRRRHPRHPQRRRHQLGCRADVDDVLAGPRQRAQGGKGRHVVPELPVVVVLEHQAAGARGPFEQLHATGDRHPRTERILVGGRDVRGCGVVGEQAGVQAVTIDRYRGHSHPLGREGRPRLGVAGVLERNGGADQAEGPGEGAQGRADPRHDEQVVGLDGDASAAAEVLGQHAAQARVGWPGAGVVARDHRPGRAPGAAPCGRVDERGVGPAGPQVPARRLRRAAFRAGVGASWGVHVGDGTGRRRPVGPGGDDRARAGPAHDEARGGELVVGGDDRPTRQVQRRGQGAGRRQRVAGSQAAGAQLGHDGVGDPVAQGCRAGRHVEGEVDGAGGARHPSTILVLRTGWLLDLGGGQLVLWTGCQAGAGRPPGGPW